MDVLVGMAIPLSRFGRRRRCTIGIGMANLGCLQCRQSILREETVAILAQIDDLAILLRQDGIHALQVRLEFGNL
jgi:hypothetical protein